MTTKFKTQGALNLPHYIPYTKVHAADVQKQKSRRVQSKQAGRQKTGLVRGAKRFEKKPPLSDDAKFSSSLAGEIFMRTDLAGWLPGQELPPAAVWEAFDENKHDDFLKVFRAIGDWHAGYQHALGKVQFYKYPEYLGGSCKGDKDHRFHLMTVTLPAWDSGALSVALKTGVLPEIEFSGLLKRFNNWAASDVAIESISCGAEHRLVYFLLFSHPEDGEFHLHPCYLKSAPLGFQKADGTLVPRSEAPKAGPRKAGEKWVGGERLGLIGEGKTKKLVTNPAGIAFCAADAMREEGIPPPIQSGGNYEFLDDKLKRRAKGDFSEKVDAPKKPRMRDRGLGEPFDLLASRVLRGLVRELAARFPRFGEIRESKIRHAHELAVSANDALLRPVVEEAEKRVAGKIAEERKKRIAVLKLVMPNLRRVAAGVMCGKYTAAEGITAGTHSSGRAMLAGRAEAEELLAADPENMDAVAFIDIISEREKAFGAFEKTSVEDNVAYAERCLFATEAKWRCEYSIYKNENGQFCTDYAPKNEDDLKFLINLYEEVFVTPKKDLKIESWKSVIVNVDPNGTPILNAHVVEKLRNLAVACLNDIAKEACGERGAAMQHLHLKLQDIARKFDLRDVASEEDFSRALTTWRDATIDEYSDSPDTDRRLGPPQDMC